MQNRRTLTINGRKLVKSGSSDRGPWNLYQLDVADHTGPLEGNFKTFTDDIPIGVPLEFNVEPRHHERYGTSYTLTPVSSASTVPPSPPPGDPYENLAEQHRLLMDRVVALEARVFGQQDPLHLPPAPTPVGGGAIGGSDDIPFAPSVI